MRHPVYRHPALLHSLQQRRLGLWAGTVDFVGQQQVGHDRARLILQVALIKRRKTDDIGRHGIRRELDPLDLQAQHPGKRQSHGGLTHAGYVLQKHMSPSQNGHPNACNDLILSDNDLFHFLNQSFCCFVHIPSLSIPIKLRAQPPIQPRLPRCRRGISSASAHTPEAAYL